MLYVVIHHYPVFDEEADANDYLIGVFATKEQAIQARKDYFEGFPSIERGIHSISITPVILNHYDENRECNVPWYDSENGKWVEDDL